MVIAVGGLESKADPLESEAALDAFLAAFESCTWPHSAWTHTAHVVMAGCYLLAYPKDEATERIRQGIFRYNERQGPGNSPDRGYHETLTIFWIRTIRAWLGRTPAGGTRLSMIRALAAEFGPLSNLFKAYYSFDVMRSREARARWVPPDCRRLE